MGFNSGFKGLKLFILLLTHTLGHLFTFYMFSLICCALLPKEQYKEQHAASLVSA